MGAEVLHQLLADGEFAGVPTALPTPVDPIGPTSGQEKLLGHGVIFLIVGWNLLAVNIARTPGKWWFWPVLAVWAGILAAQALWVSRGDRRAAAEGTVSPRQALPQRGQR
jgi:hypothetical protein